MTISGFQLGVIKIGDNLINYPGADFVKNLSLGQKMFKWNGFCFRVDKDSIIDLITTDTLGEEVFSSELKIGSKFEELIKNFVLLYDDDEHVFYIEEVKGLNFTFDHKPITRPLFMNERVSSICVYHPQIDEYNDLLAFDRITLKNVAEYIRE